MAVGRCLLAIDRWLCACCRVLAGVCCALMVPRRGCTGVIAGQRAMVGGCIGGCIGCVVAIYVVF